MTLIIMSAVLLVLGIAIYSHALVAWHFGSVIAGLALMLIGAGSLAAAILARYFL